MEMQAYGVKEFCTTHGISRSGFYALLKLGKGPKTMKVGTRTLVSTEAAKDWRKACETPSGRVH